ncbi:helix-turn-helix domain-containing protein [Bartonella sp. LJL80]
MRFIDDSIHFKPSYNPAFIERAARNNRLRAVKRENEERAIAAKERFEKALKLLEAANQTETTETVEPVIKRSTYQKIEFRICKALKITRNEIRSVRRDSEIAFARQAIMYWAVRLTPLSYPRIGVLMGGKDHTTILHGVKVYRVKRAKMGRTLRKAR